MSKYSAHLQQHLQQVVTACELWHSTVVAVTNVYAASWLWSKQHAASHWVTTSMSKLCGLQVIATLFFIAPAAYATKQHCNSIARFCRYITLPQFMVGLLQGCVENAWFLLSKLCTQIQGILCVD